MTRLKEIWIGFDKFANGKITSSSSEVAVNETARQSDNSKLVDRAISKALDEIDDVC